MKFLSVLLITLLFMSQAYAGTCEAKKILSEDQFNVVEQAYEEGKPYNYGYSMAAIVWQESSAGVALINAGEGSYGHFQINLKTAMARIDREREWSQTRKNILATKLLNFDFAVTFALAELDYWKSVHGEDWRKIWASYNGGWRYAKPAPQMYADKITSKIKKLKGCFKD